MALLALLLENQEAALVFVQDQLGALADPVAHAELRSTLLAFLENQCRHIPTAQALYLHRNTVAQRVQRAEDILQREVTVGSLELQTALRLQAYFEATSKAEHQQRV